MSKFTPKNLNSGFADVDSLNENFAALETFSDTVLSRDGTAPNTMLSSIDMNSKRIFNLPEAVTPTEPLTFGQAANLTGQSGFVSTVTEKQTATAGQTVYTLLLALYTPGVDNISVYINGSFQDPSLYVQTATNVVTLVEPSLVGDEVVFVSNQRNVSADTFPASSVTYQTSWGVATNVQEKLQESVSVRDFGAVGDGVTDDTAAVQSALNSLATSQSSVLTGSGLTYLMKGTLTLPAGVSNKVIRDISIVIDNAFSGDLKQYTYYDVGVQDNRPIIYSYQADSVVFDNVTIDGSASLPAGASYSLVLLEQATRITFLGGDFSNNQGDTPTIEGGALFLIDCDDVLFKGSYIHDIGGEGVHSRSDNIRVDGCRLETSTSSLVGSQRRNSVDETSSNLTVVNCIVKGATNSGLSINSIDSLIKGNAITSCGIGVIAGHRTTYTRRAPADNSVITDNIISDCTLQGISNSYSQGVIIANNNIKRCGLGTTDNNNAGIRSAFWGASAEIHGNTVTDCLMGILISGYKSDADETLHGRFNVYGNTITNIQRYGVLASNIEVLSICNNVIYNTDIEAVGRGLITLTGANNVNDATWNVCGNTLGKKASPDARGLQFSSLATDTNFRFADNIINCTASIYGAANNVWQSGNILTDTTPKYAITSAPSNEVVTNFADKLQMSMGSATDIETITTNLPEKSIIYISFSNGNTTMKDNVDNLLLNGDFTGTTNDTMVLVVQGANLQELSRSTN